MTARIIAGRGRARRLKSVPGPATRPTGGRIRQALFDLPGGGLTLQRSCGPLSVVTPCPRSRRCRRFYRRRVRTRATGLAKPTANFTDPAWRRAATARRVFFAIRGGLRGTPMPAWSTYSDEETWDLAACVLSLGGGGAGGRDDG